MKYSLPLLLLAFSLTVSSQLVDVSSELICPDQNPAHCYPKIFVPSDQWQVVREDQQIPPGLHVRLNLETGEKEAKLNEDTNEPHPELMVVEQPDELHAQIDEANEHIDQQIQDTIKKYKLDRKSFLRSKVSHAELNDFSSSVDELLAFRDGGDIARLEKALNTLIDLSHDIEFGVRLTKDPTIFGTLQKVADLASDEQHVVEKCYRIMGSALRNNPEAVENVLLTQSLLFITDLFDLLRLPSTSDVIQKRILGVIQALAADSKFAYQYLNLEDLHYFTGLDQLLTFFPKAGRSAKERIITILEDLKVIEDSPSSVYDERSLQMSVKPEYKVSKLLQSMLVDGKTLSETQFQSLFNILVDLHRSSTLDSSKEFIQWLSEEVELRKLGKRERDHIYSGGDPNFDAFMLEVRHAVFGNPNAHRKAHIDEL